MPDANPAPSPGIRTLSSTVSTVASSASAASTAEHLDIETLSQDSLDSEIAMLRIVTRRVLDLLSGVEDLETAFNLLALLSQASVLRMPHPFVSLLCKEYKCSWLLVSPTILKLS